jgi:hypothetical protein
MKEDMYMMNSNRFKKIENINQKIGKKTSEKMNNCNYFYL